MDMRYRWIPLEFLEPVLQPLKTQGVDHAGLRLMSNTIERSLDDFGLAGKTDQVLVGPTITRFVITPGMRYISRKQNDMDSRAIAALKKKGYGTKSKPMSQAVIERQRQQLVEYQQRRTRLSDYVAIEEDLGMSLARPVTVTALPEMNGVAIDVPNQDRTSVPLLAALYKLDLSLPLPLAAGVTLSGGFFNIDLAQLPHLLVAGHTGSGKSMFLHCQILNLATLISPDDLKIMMIDTKMVELAPYVHLPHTLQVITESNGAAKFLSTLVTYMDGRYRFLKGQGLRSITEYHERGYDDMPYIVVIVDELADLIIREREKVEHAILALAQKSRAVGIHLILSTQRPSVDIITGVIKANLPARIAFTVATGTDSKVILDRLGANTLTGLGDMLFHTPGHDMVRTQAPCVSATEIDDLIDLIRHYEGPETSY